MPRLPVLMVFVARAGCPWCERAEPGWRELEATARAHPRLRLVRVPAEATRDDGDGRALRIPGYPPLPAPTFPAFAVLRPGERWHLPFGRDPQARTAAHFLAVHRHELNALYYGIHQNVAPLQRDWLRGATP
jgi:hypothetical protein